MNAERDLQILQQIDPSPQISDEELHLQQRKLMQYVESRERAGLTAKIGHTWRYHRSKLVVALVVVFSAGSGATAWALSNPTESATVVCPSDTIIDSRSGDPIEDCVEALELSADQVVTLRAYSSKDGAVMVLPEGEQPPSGYSLLPESFRQDISRIELRNTLEDTGHSPVFGGSCESTDQSQSSVQSELNRLGLSSWAIKVAEKADGSATCASAFVVDGESSVQIGAAPSDAGDDLSQSDTAKFAQAAHAAIDAKCLSLSDAVAQVQQLAAKFGTEISVHQVDDTRGCASLTVVVTGGTDVTVYG